MDIQIQSIHFDADDTLVSFIKEKIDKLATYFDQIIDAEVYLRLENNNAQVKDKLVHLKINIPGATLMAKESSKKFEESVDMAVESISRQLKKQKEKMRN